MQPWTKAHVVEACNKISWRMQVAKTSEVIFLAVKPQYVATVLKEIKQHLTDSHIVVSIAAGIPLAVMKVGAILLCCHSEWCHIRFGLHCALHSVDFIWVC